MCKHKVDLSLYDSIDNIILVVSYLVSILPKAFCFRGEEISKETQWSDREDTISLLCSHVPLLTALDFTRKLYFNNFVGGN